MLVLLIRSRKTVLSRASSKHESCEPKISVCVLQSVNSTLGGSKKSCNNMFSVICFGIKKTLLLINSELEPDDAKINVAAISRVMHIQLPLYPAFK